MKGVVKENGSVKKYLRLVQSSKCTKIFHERGKIK